MEGENQPNVCTTCGSPIKLPDQNEQKGNESEQSGDEQEETNQE